MRQVMPFDEACPNHKPLAPGASIKIKASYLPFERFESNLKESMTANEASPPPPPPPPLFQDSNATRGADSKGDLLSNVERMVMEDERRKRRDRAGQVGSLLNGQIVN